jgi:DNA (cytosine-5)-methyltransferase 1
MNHGSLFSGIGGFDLAAEWAGFTNIFHCEWNDFGRKVLKHHFPNAESFSDITKTDFNKYHGSIDIISGGFPCQPFSFAGKRKGKEDERYLWHEMLRAIQEIKPTYVIAENVFGLINIDEGMVFEQVCIDLEAEGYEVQPFIVPACAKDAPHRRDRVWIVAYSNECTKGLSGSSGKTQRNWRENNDEQSCGRKQTEQHTGCSDVFWISSDTKSTRSKRKRISKPNEIQFDRRNSSKIQTDFINFPTKSPICGRNDGIPRELDDITFPKWRNESIKGYGNAIVPQVAYEIFQSIKEHYESNQNTNPSHLQHSAEQGTRADQTGFIIE